MEQCRRRCRKKVLELNKDGDLTAREAVDALPVIANTEELCAGLPVDKATQQFQALERDILKLINKNMVIALTVALRLLLDQSDRLVYHVMKINLVVSSEVVLIFLVDEQRQFSKDAVFPSPLK